MSLEEESFERGVQIDDSGYGTGFGYYYLAFLSLLLIFLVDNTHDDDYNDCVYDYIHDVQRFTDSISLSLSLYHH